MLEQHPNDVCLATYLKLEVTGLQKPDNVKGTKYSSFELSSLK